MGGDDTDTGGKVVAQLSDLVTGVQSLNGFVEAMAVADNKADSNKLGALSTMLENLGSTIAANKPQGGGC